MRGCLGEVGGNRERRRDDGERLVIGQPSGHQLWQESLVDVDRGLVLEQPDRGVGDACLLVIVRSLAQGERLLVAAGFDRGDHAVRPPNEALAFQQAKVATERRRLSVELLREGGNGHFVVLANHFEHLAASKHRALVRALFRVHNDLRYQNVSVLRTMCTNSTALNTERTANEHISVPTVARCQQRSYMREALN